MDILVKKSIYFSLLRDIRIVYHNSNIILLNLDKDEYLILPEGISEDLNLILMKSFAKSNGRYYLIGDLGKRTNVEEIDGTIRYLREIGILSNLDHEKQQMHKINKKITSGASNIDWKINPGDLDAKCKIKEFCRIYLILIKVFYTSYCRGFKQLLNLVKIKKPRNPITSTDSSLEILAKHLNYVCFFSQ